MYNYFQNFRSEVKVVGHRKVKNVLLVISRRRIVVESRDWCQYICIYMYLVPPYLKSM